MSTATQAGAALGAMPAAEAARDYTLADQRLMAGAPNYFAWQARLVIPHLGKTVIEVGCGIGNFTGHLLDRELVVAVDREPASIAALARRFPGRNNLQAQVADLSDDGLLALRRFRPDSCVCLNVLEHVADDRAALSRLAALLPAGGTVALIVPALPALYGPIDASLGHFRRYSPATLRDLAVAAGLAVRRLHYWNALGAVGWWTNARLLRRARQSPLQIACFDRWLAPPLEWLEARLAPPFGQSLLAVLAKP